MVNRNLVNKLVQQTDYRNFSATNGTLVDVVEMLESKFICSAFFEMWRCFFSSITATTDDCSAAEERDHELLVKT